MHILILNWRDRNHPNAGGAEIATHEHAKRWVQQGCTVTLFTSHYKGAKEKETIDGITIIRRGRAAFGVHWEAFRWYTWEKEDQFDLIIDQFHGIPFFTPLYVREKKLAFIHEVAKEVWKLNPWPKPFNLIPYVIGSIGEQWIFRLLYRHIPFLTVSDSTKRDLEAWGIPSRNITIIHNGVEKVPFHQKDKKESVPTVLYLGALSVDKGVEDTLKTFRKVYADEKNIQFWVAGYGTDEYVKKLQLLTKEYGIHNVTKFWGYVSNEKKYELFRKAHLLINQSVREGWGLVIIESASQRTPAVVYNAPGLRDSVQHNVTGIIASENTPDAVAKEIVSILNNRQQYNKLQDECYRWSQTFSWDKAAKDSLTLLKNI